MMKGVASITLFSGELPKPVMEKSGRLTVLLLLKEASLVKLLKVSVLRIRPAVSKAVWSV